jgi:hypothetical protein
MTIRMTIRRSMLLALVASGALSCAAPAPRPQETPMNASIASNTTAPTAPAASTSPEGFTTERTGGLHDFDFLAGHWNVTNRRLRVRGADSTEWEAFPSTTQASLHMGGITNMDETVFPTLGTAGMTIRTFDLAKRQWSIYWISSRSGVLFPPVVGGFAGDRGEFYGEDVDDGHPVKVRFVWTRLGPNAARWEQAFSRGGSAWETNWIMEFSRI